MITLQPLKTQVLVEAVKEENKTGIVLPDTAKDKQRPTKGKVVGVGEEVKEVKNDQLILFPKYSATEVEVGDDKYLVMKEEDILLIIHEK